MYGRPLSLSMLSIIYSLVSPKQNDPIITINGTPRYSRPDESVNTEGVPPHGPSPGRQTSILNNATIPLSAADARFPPQQPCHQPAQTTCSLPTPALFPGGAFYPSQDTVPCTGTDVVVITDRNEAADLSARTESEGTDLLSAVRSFSELLNGVLMEQRSRCGRPDSLDQMNIDEVSRKSIF